MPMGSGPNTCWKQLHLKHPCPLCRLSIPRRAPMLHAQGPSWAVEDLKKGNTGPVLRELLVCWAQDTHLDRTVRSQGSSGIIRKQ